MLGFPVGQRLAGVCDNTAPNQCVSGANHVAKEVDAIRQRSKPDILLKAELQGASQKGLDFCLPCFQLVAVLVYQYKVVDIAQVTLRLERVLDELVELVQVGIGEELTTEIAYGQPAILRGVLKALVVRDQCPIRCRAMVLHAEVKWVSAQQDVGGFHHLLRDAGPHQARFQNRPEDGAVNRVEEVVNIQLEIPATTLAAMYLSNECLKAPDGGVATLAAPVGIAVENKQRLPYRFELWHQPVMHDPVCEVGGVDLAGLRASGDEAGAASWLPGAVIELPLQFEEAVRPLSVEIQLILARFLACPGSAPGSE